MGNCPGQIVPGELLGDCLGGNYPVGNDCPRNTTQTISFLKALLERVQGTGVVDSNSNEI